MSNIITEITPLSENDSFYMVDRHKNRFDYPIHKHNEIEINFVSNCEGCKRIVGDSVETTGYYDLVMVGSNVEHGWDQNDIKQEGVLREITIQWTQTPGDINFLHKTQMAPLRELFSRAQSGIAFGQEIIKTLMPKFEEFVAPQPGFLRFLKLLEILYYMSVTNDCHQLSTTAFAKAPDSSESRRVTKIKNYVNKNYSKPLRLEELAALINMAPTAFSRFFKKRTGQTLSEYILNIRLGHAIRLLVETSMNCSEICYDCGFNNVSNFNRLFRKKKGCTPLEFRANYFKTKIIV